MNTVALFLLLMPVQTPDGLVTTVEVVQECPTASLVVRAEVRCVPVRVEQVAADLWSVPATEPKNPRSALLWSLAGTGAVFIPGVNVVALVVGPAAGHIYAENLPQVWITSSIRSLGILALVGAALSGFDGGTDEDVEQAIVVASALWIGASVFDIATAPAAARRYNRRHGQTGLAPIYGSDGTGVRLATRF